VQGYDDRVRRWLFGIFAAVSLMLLIGIASLWAMAWYGDKPISVTLWPKPHLIELHALPRSLQVEHTSLNARTPFSAFVPVAALPAAWKPLTTMPSFSGNVNFSTSTWSKWGINFDQGGNSVGTINGPLNAALFIPWQLLTLPYWLVMIPSAVAPLIFVRGAIRRRRILPANMCRQCGYDLRATPDRCPECGAVPRPL
jgi:hypothetical protein